MQRKTTVLVLCILLNLAQYNLWPYIQHNFFYIAESVQYFLLGTILYSMADLIHKNIESKKSREWILYFQLTVMLWITFAVNDFVDLLFFDPKKFGWNEVFFCGIAFIITFYKLRQQWKQNHKTF